MTGCEQNGFGSQFSDHELPIGTLCKDLFSFWFSQLLHVYSCQVTVESLTTTFESFNYCIFYGNFWPVPHLLKIFAKFS